jgi:hypothetical protein
LPNATYKVLTQVIISKKTQINSINLYMWLGGVTGEIESALEIRVGFRLAGIYSEFDC